MTAGLPIVDVDALARGLAVRYLELAEKPPSYLGDPLGWVEWSLRDALERAADMELYRWITDDDGSPAVLLLCAKGGYVWRLMGELDKPPEEREAPLRTELRFLGLLAGGTYSEQIWWYDSAFHLQARYKHEALPGGVLEETARTKREIEHRRFDTLRRYLHSRATMND